ncbi:hypothetical protein A9174_10690 [Mesorhizobium loti NZP2037]|nr:hypothetical protein A9174_10690 [Mesorhizobium loti NZP2037]
MVTGLARILISLFVVVGSSLTATAAPDVVRVPMKHYSGTWLEIARTPMFITDGCVAGFTTYRRGRGPADVEILDGCHQGTPSGTLKTVKGKGRLLDPNTTRAKLYVRYPFFISFNYWVLYVSPDQGWFISADPQLNHLWIYARRIPNAHKLSVMVRKAKNLGYDVNKLEFPQAK